MTIKRIELDRGARPKHGYSLPFDFHEIVISQGYHGEHSHHAIIAGDPGVLVDDSYAIDFALPFGTPVLAAKDGTVYGKVQSLDSCYEGIDIEKGMRFHPNFMMLEHDDGLFTLYSHLQKGSIDAKVGKEVKRGEQIALTGRSGWIGPVAHLHFGVYNLPRNGRVFRSSYPVLFDGLEKKL